MSGKITERIVFDVSLGHRRIGSFDLDEICELNTITSAIIASRCHGHVVHPEMIVCAVCDYFGLKRSALFRKARPARIAWPRQICMALIYEKVGWSTNKIGKFFGGKDHGTVLHARDVVQARRQTITDGRIIQAIEAALSKQLQSVPALQCGTGSDANSHSGKLDSRGGVASEVN